LKLKPFVFAVALIFGVSLILFQKQLSHFLSATGSRGAGSPLAQIESFSGVVLLRAPHSLTSVEATPGDKIFDQESLEVPAASQATIKFLTGLTVSLSPDTVLHFELSDGIFVTFKKGDYKIVQSGQSSEKIYFIREGVVFDPMGRLVSKPITIQVKETSEGPQATHDTEGSDSSQVVPLENKRSEPLTDDQITRTLANLRGHFSTCYAQTLKDQPDAKGQFYFSTTIQNNGQTSQTRIIQSSLQNETLKECLVKAIGRAQFDSFKGDPIVVNFPIFLE
jgi:hypothetical protein